MSRPTVLVATTNPVMAYALSKRLTKPCRELGLKLEICPEGGNIVKKLEEVRTYESAEELFDCLAARTPMDLAETLVVLDVGVELEQAFRPAVQGGDAGWHVTKQRRAGVAVELILCFPQVFPVFLSPAVPTDAVDADKTAEYTGVVAPEQFETSDEVWRGFDRLVKFISQDNNPIEKIVSFDTLRACCVPLHFISPLDHGVGLCSTLARFARGMRCWFDPTGLRTLVKNCFLGILFGNQEKWKEKSSRDVLLERLQRVAITVDEEREFAVLNAYTSYKFGRRAWMVTTFAEFDTFPLWVVDSLKQQVVQNVVVIRDIDLRFPDIPDDADKNRKLIIDNADVPARDQLKLIDSPIWENCDDGTTKRLGDDWFIRCVSSHRNVKNAKGHNSDPGQEPVGTPITLAPDEHKFFGLAKPIATLYDLTQLIEKSGDHKSVASRLKSTQEQSSGGHGAPYLNLAMAESLLQQGGRCENGPVENLIGALLAGEAYELLLGMSKTTALEALMMMHKKEVAAETGFPGVSQDLDISARKRDVEATLDLFFEQDASRPSNRKNNARKTKNLFLSRFWADLRPVYRDAELFEPAEAANRESLIYAQWLPRCIRDIIKWSLPDIVATPFQWLKKGCVYAATQFFWLSLPTLIIWLVSIGFYGKWQLEITKRGVKHFFFLLKETILTSLALQPTDAILQNYDGWWLVVHVILSYALFGILISMLYRKITRG